MYTIEVYDVHTAKTQAYVDEKKQGLSRQTQNSKCTQNIYAAQPEPERTLCHKLLSWSGRKNWKSSRMRLCAKPKLSAQ